MEADKILINKILDGSSGHFDLLMRRYEKLIYNIAYSFTKNSELSMDLTQEIFLKCYRSLHTLRNKDDFKKWLVKISYNEGISWKRKNKNYHFDEIDEETMENDTSVLNSDQQVIAKEQRAMLLKSLFTLNTKYRLAVILRYYKETPIKEIAEVLETSEGVVKNMLYRSLQRIRNDLNKRGIINEFM